MANRQVPVARAAECTLPRADPSLAETLCRGPVRGARFVRMRPVIQFRGSRRCRSNASSRCGRRRTKRAQDDPDHRRLRRAHHGRRNGRRESARDRRVDRHSLRAGSPRRARSAALHDRARRISGLARRLASAARQGTSRSQQSRERQFTPGQTRATRAGTGRFAERARKLARYRPLAAENAVTQVDLDEAIAAEEVARAKVTAAQELVKDATVQRRVAIEQARAVVEQNEAAVKKDEINLGYTRITAPVAGLIGFVKVDKGNLVSADSPPLATISTIDPMAVQFALTEVDYLNLVHRLQRANQNSAPDLPLELILADGTVYPFKGRPQSLDRAIDPRTGTIAVIGTFPNPPGSLGILRPGLFGRVRIVLGFNHDAVLVPQRAVVQQQGSDTVYVVGKDKKVSLRSVRLGQRTGSDYVVTSGLGAGETVVVEGTQKVQPGSSVVATAPASSEK